MPSANYIEELNALTGDAPVLLIEFHHDDLLPGTPMRFVQDNDSITSNGEVYSPLPISITLPNQADKGIPTATLVIDNCDPSQLIPYINQSDGGQGFYVKFLVVSRSTPSVIELSLQLDVESITVSATQISCVCSYINLLDKGALIPQYRPHNFPGVFH